MDSQNKLNKIINKIASGHAVLFTGAGFSLNSININNDKELPLAKSLAIKISQLIINKFNQEFQTDDDLQYVSDYYLRNNYSKQDLINLLKQTFSIKDVNNNQIEILKAPWKRIYTTNYDNTTEECFKKLDKRYFSISSYREDFNDYSKNENLCIHINGFVEQLNKKTLETEFKLSTSSYISPDEFVKTACYRQLKRDFERSSVLIFIGYSLYDLDIKKILHEKNIEYKEKTFFIIHESASTKDIFQLEQYGSVFTFGINGLADVFKQQQEKFSNTLHNEFYTEAFIEYKIYNDENSITDEKIESFLKYGVAENNYIQTSLLSNNANTIIEREYTDIIYNQNNQKYIFVISDFGNGKTIFLQELMFTYSINNKTVFYLNDFTADYITDLEKLNNLEKTITVFIDGYAQCLDIFDFLNDNTLENLNFIFSERSSVHNGLKKDILTIEQSNEFYIDKLTDSECKKFINIIDTIGYWGEKSHLSFYAKKQFLQGNGNELSINLLNLFDSKHIKEKLNQLVLNINNSDYKDTLFAICLLEAIGISIDQSLISEVACNDAIYSSDFKMNKNIQELFKFNGNELLSKSSLYSIYMLNNVFPSTYIIDKLIILSEKFNELQHDNYINKEIFRYLLRFNFIQRILPKGNQNNSLVMYYEKLKDAMYWLKKDIHYWLQYAMCQIALEKYDTAQKYLDNAYAFASNKEDYDTFYIDSQQSRLFLIQAQKTHIAQLSFSFFEKAHNIILSLPNDVYKFKRVLAYYDLYKLHYQNFSKKNKQFFINACQDMLNEVKNIEKQVGYEYYNTNKIYFNCEKQLSKIANKS